MEECEQTSSLNEHLGVHKRQRTDTQHEVVEGLVVEVVQGHLHCQGKVCQVREMLPALNQRLILRLHSKNTKEITLGQNLGTQVKK